MKIYELNDGTIIGAVNNIDLTIKINNSSLFGYKQDIQEFMQETAKACKLQNGSEIRSDEGYDCFIEDLILGGFIKEIEE